MSHVFSLIYPETISQCFFDFHDFEITGQSFFFKKVPSLGFDYCKCPIPHPAFSLFVSKRSQFPIRHILIQYILIHFYYLCWCSSHPRSDQYESLTSFLRVPNSYWPFLLSSLGSVTLLTPCRVWFSVPGSPSKCVPSSPCLAFISLFWSSSALFTLRYRWLPCSDDFHTKSYKKEGKRKRKEYGKKRKKKKRNMYCFSILPTSLQNDQHFPSFHTWGNCGSERLSLLPRVSQPLHKESAPKSKSWILQSRFCLLHHTAAKENAPKICLFFGLSPNVS